MHFLSCAIVAFPSTEREDRSIAQAAAQAIKGLVDRNTIRTPYGRKLKKDTLIEEDAMLYTERDGSFRTHRVALLAPEKNFDHERDVLDFDLLFLF